MPLYRSALQLTTFGRSTAATLEDLREALTTLEDTDRIARRVLGGAHPTTTGIGEDLQSARAVLSAREAGISYAIKPVS